jgi:hypothetical protein
MPTSKRYRNWTATTFATVAIDGVRSVTLDDGIEDLQEGADMDLGPTHSVVVFQKPSFNITTYNAGIITGIAAGVFGVFTTTLADSRNGVGSGSGAMTFTTNSQAYVGSRSLEGQFNQLATKTIMIKTNWADGVTNPVSIATA